MTCPPDHPHDNRCYAIHRCRDETCREAHSKVCREGRNCPPVTADATPARDYLRALYALGWTPRALAEQTGVALTTLEDVMYGRRKRIRKENGRAIVTTFNRLSMTTPEMAGLRLMNAGTARRYAKQRGWLPPLDLEDIA